MAENGKWTQWVVNALWGILTISFLGLVNNVIANDKDSRQRDTELCKQVTIDKQEQAKVNQEILIALTSIQTDLKYVVREVKK